MRARVVAFLLLAGCAGQPISNAPVTSLEGAVVKASPTLQVGLQEVAFNFDNAAGLGLYQATDPRVTCPHEWLRDAGLEQTPGAAPPKAFLPHEATALGRISADLIRLDQVRALSGPGAPTSCDAVMAFVIKRLLREGSVLTLPTALGIRLP